MCLIDLRRPSRIVTAVLVAFLVTGCAGWHRITVLSDTVLAERQQVQVWVGSRARVLHGVRLTSDSVLGVPFHQSLRCDSCRVSLPRSHVDSLRLGNQEGSAIVVAMLPFAAIILLLLAIGDGDVFA
jgi:hypothetical protein